MDKLKPDAEYNAWDGEFTAYSVKQIEDAPIVEMIPIEYTERKRGEWKHDGSIWENRWVCSECGYKLFDEQTNYCPNCGAMIKEVE